MSLSIARNMCAAAVLASTAEAAYYASREHHHPNFHQGGHGWRRHPSGASSAFSDFKLPTITDFDALVPEFFEIFGRKSENSFIN